LPDIECCNPRRRNDSGTETCKFLFQETKIWQVENVS